METRNRRNKTANRTKLKKTNKKFQGWSDAPGGKKNSIKTCSEGLQSGVGKFLPNLESPTPTVGGRSSPWSRSPGGSLVKAHVCLGYRASVMGHGWPGAEKMQSFGVSTKPPWRFWGLFRDQGSLSGTRTSYEGKAANASRLPRPNSRGPGQSQAVDPTE